MQSEEKLDYSPIRRMGEDEHIVQDYRTEEKEVQGRGVNVSGKKFQILSQGYTYNDRISQYHLQTSAYQNHPSLQYDKVSTTTFDKNTRP